jgi:hypothetical protein
MAQRECLDSCRGLAPLSGEANHPVGARPVGIQEGQEAKVQERGYGQVLPPLFRKTPGPYQRDY